MLTCDHEGEVSTEQKTHGQSDRRDSEIVLGPNVKEIAEKERESSGV